MTTFVRQALLVGTLLVLSATTTAALRNRAGGEIHPHQAWQFEQNPVNDGFCNRIFDSVRCKQPPYFDNLSGKFDPESRKHVEELCSDEFAEGVDASHELKQDPSKDPACRRFYPEGGKGSGASTTINFPNIKSKDCCADAASTKRFLDACTSSIDVPQVACQSVKSAGPSQEEQARFTSNRAETSIGTHSLSDRSCPFGKIRQKGAATPGNAALSAPGSCCPGEDVGPAQGRCRNDHPKMYSLKGFVCWTTGGNNWGYCTPGPSEYAGPSREAQLRFSSNRAETSIGTSVSKENSDLMEASAQASSGGSRFASVGDAETWAETRSVNVEMEGSQEGIAEVKSMAVFPAIDVEMPDGTTKSFDTSGASFVNSDDWAQGSAVAEAEAEAEEEALEAEAAAADEKNTDVAALETEEEAAAAAVEAAAADEKHTDVAALEAEEEAAAAAAEEDADGDYGSDGQTGTGNGSKVEIIAELSKDGAAGEDEEEQNHSGKLHAAIITDGTEGAYGSDGGSIGGGDDDGADEKTGPSMAIGFPNIEFKACCSSDEDTEGFLDGCTASLGLPGVACAAVGTGDGDDAAGITVTLRGSEDALRKVGDMEEFPGIVVAVEDGMSVELDTSEATVTSVALDDELYAAIVTDGEQHNDTGEAEEVESDNYESADTYSSSVGGDGMNTFDLGEFIRDV